MVEKRKVYKRGGKKWRLIYIEKRERNVDLTVEEKKRERLIGKKDHCKQEMGG